MTEQPNTPRDELTKLIAVDGLSDADLIMVSLTRILKTQSEQNARLDEIETQFGWFFVDATIDEILALRVDLRDSSFFQRKDGPLARAHAFLQREIEKDDPALRGRGALRRRGKTETKTGKIGKIEDL
jgi:hypothetical protein